MAALDEDSLIQLNVDVVSAVTTVLGKLPKLRALRPEIVQHLQTFDVERFDRLEEYACALNHANTLHRGTLEHRSNIIELGAGVTQLRDRLSNVALSLTDFGLINAELLKDVKKTPGYKALASDVFLLVTIFKENWSQIQSRSPVTAELLDEAAQSASELMGAIAEKDDGPSTPAEAAGLRQRAYTLFFNAYEDARAAVAYLRRNAKEEVIDNIAPTLFSSRGRAISAALAAKAKETEAPATDAKPNPSSPAADVTVPVINNPHNLPIDSPFN
ncbi:MAG: hypothetical protein RL033_1948 [Pseudomonadota bacterium]